MLTIIGSLIGFGTSFLPSILDFFKEKESNRHELALMDKHWKTGELEPVLEEAYGKGKGREWYVNWRLFYLACAELFGMNSGEEWMVSHYLFERRG